mmetsp:Transcript_20153/g.51322  ORF Transcript_20153/g.51322 Transcript_20153/m.51322 type:complete len:167 (-) Transcript_20153:1108-1608(-)
MCIIYHSGEHARVLGTVAELADTDERVQPRQTLSPGLRDRSAVRPMSFVSQAHYARAELNKSGRVLLRVPHLQGAESIMQQLSDLLHTNAWVDGWPTYAQLGADRGRRPLSKYFHGVSQRRAPTVVLAPHNELSYVPSSPIGVVAFVGLSVRRLQWRAWRDLSESL